MEAAADGARMVAVLEDGLALFDDGAGGDVIYVSPLGEADLRRAAGCIAGDRAITGPAEMMYWGNGVRVLTGADDCLARVAPVILADPNGGLVYPSGDRFRRDRPG